jgi:hypothetical protein
MARSIERLGERATPFVIVNERNLVAMESILDERVGIVRRQIAPKVPAPRLGAQVYPLPPTKMGAKTMKYVALLLGIMALAVGVASFVPAAVVNGLLFGLVQVSVIPALVLMAAGVLGIIAGLMPDHELIETAPHNEHDLREWLAH